MSEQDRNAAARIDDLWNDEMLLAICAALQDCGITHARLGDNILPNAKRFRDALASAGYRLTAPDARSGTVTTEPHRRRAVAAAIRQSLWSWWGHYVPHGDGTLSSLSDTAVEGYFAAADAAIAAAEGGSGERGEGDQ